MEGTALHFTAELDDDDDDFSTVGGALDGASGFFVLIMDKNMSKMNDDQQQTDRSIDRCILTRAVLSTSPLALACHPSSFAHSSRSLSSRGRHRLGIARGRSNGPLRT